MTEKILIGILTSIGIAAIVWSYRNWLLPFALFLRNLATVSGDVRFIKKELLSNGGSSLKDRVTGIDQKLTMIEGRQRGLMSALPRATFETDGEFNWIDCNMALERLTGAGFQHLVRRRWVSLIHTDHRINVMREVSEAVADRRNIDVTFRIADEHETEVRMEAQPVLDRQPGADKLLCWIGSLTKVPLSDFGSSVLDRRVEDRRNLLGIEERRGGGGGGL